MQRGFELASYLGLSMFTCKIQRIVITTGSPGLPRVDVID